MRNVASVIVNYANYCKENLEYNYSRFIFPKIYGVQYNQAIQLGAYQTDFVTKGAETFQIVYVGKGGEKDYADKDISKKVRKAARPFIEWLEQAESESESD